MLPLPEPAPVLFFAGVTAVAVRSALLYAVAFLKTALRKKIAFSAGSVYESVTLQMISFSRDFYLPRRLDSESADVDGLKIRINRLVVATQWLGLLGIVFLVWGLGVLLTA
ncbi:MAG: hypothetical protein M3Y54_14005 [Bacteroidota bacterium]|nr:hypothetical protein [Bacteroidota bacterium]